MRNRHYLDPRRPLGPLGYAALVLLLVCFVAAVWDLVVLIVGVR